MPEDQHSMSPYTIMTHLGDPLFEDLYIIAMNVYSLAEQMQIYLLFLVIFQSLYESSPLNISDYLWDSCLEAVAYNCAFGLHPFFWDKTFSKHST